MLVLGIETATQVCSAALWDSEKKALIAECSLVRGNTHSERLTPLIDQLLSLAGVDKQAIGGIAVSIGPGSFTGLRIGLAAAKTMAYAWQVPLVGISTLTALAQSVPAPGVILCPLLDAQKGNAYYALYAWQDGRMVTLEEPGVIAATTLWERFSEPGPAVLLLGEAAKYPIPAAAAARVQLLPEPVRLPRAALVAGLGATRLADGRPDDAFTLSPAYIRRSEAEELWEKKQKNP